jgi:hypothetical protein
MFISSPDFKPFSDIWPSNKSAHVRCFRAELASSGPSRAARHQISLDPEARNARHTHLSEDGLTIHQTLIDWSLHLTLDLEKSNEARTPVLHLESIDLI